MRLRLEDISVHSLILISCAPHDLFDVQSRYFFNNFICWTVFLNSFEVGENQSFESQLSFLALYFRLNFIISMRFHNFPRIVTFGRSSETFQLFQIYIENLQPIDIGEGHNWMKLFTLLFTSLKIRKKGPTTLKLWTQTRQNC